MTAALLAASRGNHSDIVKCILLMDLSVMPESTDRLEDLTCVFEVKMLTALTVSLFLCFGRLSGTSVLIRY